MASTKITSTTSAARKEEQSQRSGKPAKPVELRCKLCSSEYHRSTQCEDRCRSARCVDLKLNIHSWAECPFKTRPFCQLCGETGHGVFKHSCIHRCYVHESWIHLIEDCPTTCNDCGLSGHRSRSEVCSMRFRRRPARRTSAKRATNAVNYDDEQREEQQAQAKSKPVTQEQTQKATPVNKKGAQSAQQQAELERKRKEEAEAAKRQAKEAEEARKKEAAAEAELKAKEEKLQQALAELKKEKARIMQELAQLQASKRQPTQQPKKAELLATTGHNAAGRIGLKQSRG